MWRSLRLSSAYGRYLINVTSMRAGIKQSFCNHFWNWFIISCNVHWNILVFILVIYHQDGKISHSINGLILFWNMYLQIITFSFPENRLLSWIEFLEIWCLALYLWATWVRFLFSGRIWVSHQGIFIYQLHFLHKTLWEMICFKLNLKHSKICSYLEIKAMPKKIFLLLIDFPFHNCSAGFSYRMGKRPVGASYARVPVRRSFVKKKMLYPHYPEWISGLLEWNQRRKLSDNLSLPF